MKNIIKPVIAVSLTFGLLSSAAIGTSHISCSRKDKENIPSVSTTEEKKKSTETQTSDTSPKEETFSLDSLSSSVVPVQSSAGKGCGIVFSDGGENTYIITTQELAKNQNDISLTIHSQKLTPTLVGTDSRYGISLLRIPDGENTVYLKPITYASSYELGEKVYSVGSMEDESLYFSSGIISLIRDKDKVPFVLSDVAIHEENRGGPVVNEKGELIAMIPHESKGTLNSFTLVDKNFTDTINAMAENQTKDNSFTLGLDGTTIDADLHHQLGIPIGVYVSNVEPGSPAETAGILVGDVITGFQGRSILSLETLKEEMNRINNDSPIILTVKRLNHKGSYYEKEYEIKPVAQPDKSEEKEGNQTWK